MSQSIEDGFPKQSGELYFVGIFIHGLMLWVRKKLGRRMALSLLKSVRMAAKLYAAGRPGFSLRDGETGDSLTGDPRRAARLLLALLDRLEPLISED